ncbi:MAG TPA: FAD-dependent monooxygenase [Gemmataceae bacterium]|nr:FAD-dependent monooxygenase [Gemmataceae bacterium]
MTIGPTLSLADASARTWDAVVVGAGPAGAVAARELARRGTTVLLVDRASFPRNKVCGACLNVRALAALAAVGLGDLVERLGAVRLVGLHLAAEKTSARIRLPGGAALTRAALDAALVEAAIQAGAEFLPRADARLGDCTAQERLITLSRDGKSTTVAGRIILAADGLAGGFLRRQAGGHAIVTSDSYIGTAILVDEAPSFYAPGNIFMACRTGGYVGLVRVEAGRLNVAAAFGPDTLRRAGEAGLLVEDILEEAGFPHVPGLVGPVWHGTPLLTRRLTKPALERVLVIGDAAGYVEPFTGEGIAWALESALGAVPVAVRGCMAWSPALAREWTRRYRRLIGSRQWTCRMARQALRHRGIVRSILAALSRAPALAAPVIYALNRIPAKDRHAPPPPDRSAGRFDPVLGSQHH